MVELPPWPILATISLLRILLAVSLLTFALPWFVFPEAIERKSSPWVARALWLAFAATAVVHLLVVIRLYEALVFLALCLGAGVWNRLLGLSWVDRHRTTARTLAWLFDHLDGKQMGAPREERPARRLAVQIRENGWTWLGWAALLVALGVAAWILFDSAFTTSAPPFSDAPVNVAWLKYMDNNDLYHWNHAEVYPRGMYAALSLIAKFTALNAVLVVDIAGPLIGLTIVLSLLFFVYRTTGSLGAVIVAAVLYGTLPSLVSPVYVRHAAPNSQEYGLIFVLPAAWFAFSYLREGRRADRASAAAAAGVVAFTHPVPTLFVIVAMAGTSLVALLGGGRAVWRRLPGLIAWVAGAGVVAVLPVAAVLALGQQWHGASVSYLQLAVGASPPIDWVQIAIMAGAVLLMLVTILLARRPARAAAVAPLGAAAAVVALALLLNQLPALGVHSQALEDRVNAIGGLGLAIAAGLLWSLLERLLGRFRKVSVLPAAALAAASWFLLSPAPVHPYRYYTDEMIQAYLWSDATYSAGSWTLVANATTGYALAIGRCLHLTPDQFITLAERMPPEVEGWYEGDQQSSTHELTEHYVLMIEHQVPLAPSQPQSAAEPRLAESVRLSQWLLAHQGTLPLRHVFGDAALDVWTLAVPFPRDPFGFPAQPATRSAGR